MNFWFLLYLLVPAFLLWALVSFLSKSSEDQARIGRNIRTGCIALFASILVIFFIGRLFILPLYWSFTESEMLKNDQWEQYCLNRRYDGQEFHKCNRERLEKFRSLSNTIRKKTHAGITMTVEENIFLDRYDDALNEEVKEGRRND